MSFINFKALEKFLPLVYSKMPPLQYMYILLLNFIILGHVGQHGSHQTHRAIQI